MKTKILVIALMLTTVAAFAQSERRQTTSKSNGRTTSKVEDDKKKSTDSRVQTNTKGRNSNQQNSVSGNNEKSSKIVTRSSDQNSNGNRSRQEMTKQENTNRITTRTETSGNNGTNNTRSNTITTRTDNGGNRNSNGENSSRYTTGNEGVGRNTGVDMDHRENPSRNKESYNRSSVTRNIPVDHRVEERRYATTTHVRTEAHNKVYVAPAHDIVYRRTYNPYRRPVFVDIYWTSGLRDDYYRWYPDYRYWRRDVGSRIETISAYDAYDFIGDVARVYGRVTDVQYSYQNDEYYLYFGEYYPYQDFSAVLPGWVAREITHRPRRFFLGRDVAITGLITIYDDRPEIEVHNPGQVSRY